VNENISLEKLVRARTLIEKISFFNDMCKAVVLVYRQSVEISNSAPLFVYLVLNKLLFPLVASPKKEDFGSGRPVCVFVLIFKHFLFSGLT